MFYLTRLSEHTKIICLDKTGERVGRQRATKSLFIFYYEQISLPRTGLHIICAVWYAWEWQRNSFKCGGKLSRAANSQPNTWFKHFSQYIFFLSLLPPILCNLIMFEREICCLWSFQAERLNKISVNWVVFGLIESGGFGLMWKLSLESMWTTQARQRH